MMRFLLVNVFNNVARASLMVQQHFSYLRTEGMLDAVGSKV